MMDKARKYFLENNGVVVLPPPPKGKRYVPDIHVTSHGEIIPRLIIKDSK